MKSFSQSFKILGAAALTLISASAFARPACLTTYHYEERCMGVKDTTVYVQTCDELTRAYVISSYCDIASEYDQYVADYYELAKTHDMSSDMSAPACEGGEK